VRVFVIADPSPRAIAGTQLRVGGRFERHDHVVRAQGIFRPTLAVVLLTPATAVVEPLANARVVGRSRGGRRQAFLLAPDATEDLAVRLTSATGGRSSVVLAPFQLATEADLRALRPLAD
jgi:hypothetical protein